MKHARKAILAASAFLCATPLSFGWSDHGGQPLSVASAQARVGRPASPVSVAGVARRHVRRGTGYGYDAGPYGAYAAVPYGAYGYGNYRLDCAPGPRVGAFATAPWTGAPTCPPY